MADEALPTEPTPSLPPGSRGHQLVPLLLAMGGLCAGIAVAGLAQRVLAREAGLGDVFHEIARQEKIARVLPDIVREPGPTGVIIGASTLTSLDPRVIDASLHEAGIPMSTYNLAMDSSSPYADALVVRQLHAAMPSAEHRLSVAILDVQLLELTRVTRDLEAKNPFYFIPFEDPGALLSLARVRPLEAFDIAFRKYVIGEQYDGGGAQLITDRVLDAPWHCRLQPDPGSSAERAQALHDYCAFEKSVVPGGYRMTWDVATRGFNPPAPLELMPQFLKARGVDPTLSEEAQVERFDKHMRFLDRSGGLRDVRFDERSIVELEGAARELATFTDHVVFLVCPENPRTTRSADAEARIAALVARLRQTAPLLDLRRDPSFAPADFVDAIHLKYGLEVGTKYGAEVAKGLVPILTSH